LSFFLSAEMKLNEVFSVRTELGYIQKGFTNYEEILFGDNTTAGVYDKDVTFHDLALNLGCKISPFNFKWSPYISIGLRTDYMMSYEDVIGVEQGSGMQIQMFKAQIDKFNKLNLGGLIGIGLEFNDRYYFEIEYNPAITSYLDAKLLEVRDVTWGMKLGCNINKLLKK
jgi:hypothetical protein